MTLQQNARFEKDPNVVSREISGERILVPVRKKAADMAAIYVLNETGARIWDLLDGQRSLVEVGDCLAEEYETEPETVRSDVAGIVEELSELGMLRLVGHAL